MTLRLKAGAVCVLAAALSFGIVESAAAQAPIAPVGELTAAVASLSGRLLQYAGLLASVSVLAVALLELIKAVTDFRTRFHRYAISRWLDGAADRQGTEAELYYLAIGSKAHVDALFGQTLENLMGQIQAAARIALEYPDKFQHLYSFLTDSDLKEKMAEGGHVARTDSNAWLQGAVAVRNVTKRASTGDAAPDQSAVDAAQARSRLANLVSRKLDGLQMRIDYWWSRTNQTASLFISVGLMMFLLDQVDGSAGSISKIALGVAGGLLAPFMKDFSQSLASLARK